MIARGWGEGRTLTQRDTKELSGLLEVFYTVIVVVIMGLYTFHQNSQNSTPKMGEV